MDLKDKAVFDILEAFGEDLLADLDKSLRDKGHGSLANGGTQSAGIIGSGNFKVENKGGTLSLSFYLNDYWYYLEYGRRPTKAGKGKKAFKDTLAGRLL